MDKLEVKIPKVRCLNCGHKWTPRIPTPKWCPKCLHPYIEVVEEGESNGTV